MNEPSLKLQIDALDELNNAAARLIEFAGGERIFLFYGDMGAGKTTLIKSLCSNIDVTEAVSSPTFSIVNEYRGNYGNVFHFDFYRLKNQTEALDMGYEEYFYSGSYCFIEWPEKIPDLLPEHYIRVSITALSSSSREIIAQYI